jgi:hypothetical protein
MVPLATVRDTFHARVIAARLGAEGIVTELRGAVDGPYPVGDVHVLVDADRLGEAQELLLADEVESAFSGDGAPVDADDRTGLAPLWLIVAAIVVAAVLLAVRRASVG